MRALISGMIYLGSVIMVINIVRYYGFTRKMGWMRKTVKNFGVLYIPLLLLVMFLIGYLVVGILGSPDLVMAGILFGGSVFVMIILTILYYIVDLVKEVEHAEHLKEELRLAEQANRAKTTFLSNMSHDIRTPMNAIIGYTKLALRDNVRPEEMRDYLGKIDDSSHHLLTLINDVLEMSRIESGRIELDEQPTCLCESMREIRDLFQNQMEAKQIDFRVEGEGIADLKVYCDKNRLNRILLNLLSNALKFTPEGGHVTAKLNRTGIEDGRASFCLIVRDDGIGMSPEFAEKVFEAFERERTATVSGIQGTGLGMAITKTLVDRMGGTIEVESEPGKGTEFRVFLDFRIAGDDSADNSPSAAGKAPSPAVREAIPGAVASPVSGPVSVASKAAPRTDADCLSAPSPDSQAKDPDFSRMRLLLAEDNEINREIAVLILEDMGFQVDPVENGKDAVAQLEAAGPGAYDAVLMDVQMPVMDGYAATRAIRALADPALSTVPVVAMTANAFDEDIRVEREAGMDAHINKPIDVEEIRRTLRSVLNTKSEREA